MELETERLRIREFQQSDYDAVYDYSSDPDVVRYMPFGPNTPEQAQGFLYRVLSNQDEANRVNYEMAVTLKENNKLIGGCRINKDRDIHELQGLYPPLFFLSFSDRFFSP